MPLFVVFVFGSIVFGAGAMLSPALPTRGPRIALAGTLTLAFITSGSIFYGSLFGWNTLIIDYMWFAALVGIFLTGTLSAGMYRAESEGGTREYVGWPGPRELVFFAVVALLVCVPLLIFPVPLDTDAQGFGYLALVLRNGGALHTLAPFHPEVDYLYSPGFPALIAYLGERLNAGLHTIQFAVGAVLALLFIWLAYDFGNELEEATEDRRAGLVMAVCALIGLGLFTAYLDSHFTAMLGLVFGLAFLTFCLRYLREGRRADFLGAAITLSALPLAQPDMTIVIGLAFAPWLLTMWLTPPRPTLGRWLGLAVGIPGLAVLGLLPWLAKIAPLLGSDIRSPFEISVNYLVVATVYHGVIIVLIALPGIWIALRRRSTVDVMMLVWLVLILDFSSIGIIKRLFPDLPIFKYDYPFSIAWHGPIIPYLYFAGTAILSALRHLPSRERIERTVRAASLPVMGGIAVIAVLLVIGIEPLLVFSKNTPFMMYGAFSSRADVQAMLWLRDNTPRDALILNHPGPHEADWAPVIAARNTVYFRPQPFFQHTEQVDAMWVDFLAFWRNPSDPANAELLRRYGVDYVLQPQVFAEPERLTTMFRWRPPLPGASIYGVVTESPFLELVHDVDGARVYRVR